MSGSWLGRPSLITGRLRSVATGVPVRWSGSTRCHRSSSSGVVGVSSPILPTPARHAVTSPVVPIASSVRSTGRLDLMRSEVITVTDRLAGRPSGTSPPRRSVRRRDRATGCCTSSCRTPPPAWRSSRPAPAPTRTCSPRWTTCCPPTTGGGTGTARPGTGATTCCRRSCRRTPAAGARRADRARHLAVDLPGRPERRQPHPPGAVLVPPRVRRARRPRRVTAGGMDLREVARWAISREKLSSDPASAGTGRRGGSRP